MARGEIAVAWVERTVREPDWTAPDPQNPALTRSFRRIGEAGGRVLRVVHRTQGHAILVVTAFLDRGGAPMRMTCDPQADAARIAFADGQVAESEEVAPGIVLDFDAAGRVLGIEVLRARSTLAPGALAGLAAAAE